MSDVPRTDYDLIARWEWFRRDQWLPGFRETMLGIGGGSCRAFAELSRKTGARSALDCACGVGPKSVILAGMGLPVTGSDGSAVAVEHARDLADLEDAPVEFFQSAWDTLPERTPHLFDAVFCDALAWTATWEMLLASLRGIHGTLHPGGFLMFMGAGETSAPDDGLACLEHEWREEPHDKVEWVHQAGATSCIKLCLKQRGHDYIDDRLLYVIQEDGESRIESTVHRRPMYWTWQHWVEACALAGFGHIETRAFQGYGRDGQSFTLNVAWKPR